MSSSELQKFIDKMYDVTVENVIRDVKMSFRKDKKFSSYIANGYIEKMSRYAIYCKEDEQEEWISNIKNLIYLAGNADDYSIESELYAYEEAGEIMEHIASGDSWKEIIGVTNRQGHSGMSIALLAQKMLHYSPKGIEFVEEVIGDNRMKLLENISRTCKKENSKTLVKIKK